MMRKTRLFQFTPARVVQKPWIGHRCYFECTLDFVRDGVLKLKSLTKPRGRKQGLKASLLGLMGFTRTDTLKVNQVPTDWCANHRLTQISFDRRHLRWSKCFPTWSKLTCRILL